jgi:Transposase DDE domain group 1
MKKLKLEQSTDEFYTSNSGLALLGMCINKFTSLGRRLLPIAPLAHGIPHTDVVKSCLGLLSLGKSDFDAVTNKREDKFFMEALAVKEVPSEGTYRQRLDEHAERFLPVINYCVTEFVKRSKAAITGLSTGHVPLDIDVFTMDNSNTKKEGVSYTYMKYNGYSPVAAYLGLEGWIMEIEMRHGSQHSQCDFIPYLLRVLHKALDLTVAPILVRLDSAHDATDNLFVLDASERTDFIIKWNPRTNGKQYWANFGFEKGKVTNPRPGKRVAVFSVHQTLSQDQEDGSKKEITCRRVMRVIERTIDKEGQPLLIPDIEIEGWWTSLLVPDLKVIELYEHHGASEQFHSELKTDMDLERLPSGKFATNALIMACAALTYNMLRYIGQLCLLGDKSPVRHSAKRRRIKTVILELMYLAGRLIDSGRRLTLRFSRHCTSSFDVFNVAYKHLSCG